MRLPSPLRTPLGAAALSALFPGLGQAAAGLPRRGAIVAIPMLSMVGAVLLVLLLDRGSLIGAAVDQTWLTSLLILDLVALIYHLWAIVDSYLLAAREQPAPNRRMGAPAVRRWPALVGVAVIVTGTLFVHYQVAATDMAWQHDLNCFTAQTPCGVSTASGPVATYSAGAGDVAGADDSPSPGTSASTRPLATFDFSALPSAQTTDQSKNWAADGQLNVLLIGADYEAGTSRTGLRPDTMIVLHSDLATGRAALIGIPRNNVCVPLPQGIAEHYATGLNGCPGGTWSGNPSQGIASAELNWLANEAWNNPANFPDPQDDGWRRGALATTAAVGALTGLTMDGFVTINIDGLATLIDDLGGIDVTVPTKVYDEPCGQAPAWQSAWYTCAPEGYSNGQPVYHTGYSVLGDSSNVQKMIDDAAQSGGLQSITWCMPATTPSAGCHPKAGTSDVDIAFVIKPGLQHMDGQWAIAYARTRKFTTDYNRMARQQLVLKSMRSTFNPCAILPKVPGLIQHVGSALNTDMPINSESAIRQWINLAQRTLAGNVKTIVLDPTTTGESFLGGYPAIDQTAWNTIKGIVAHSLDDVPAATSSGGGGGGGLGC